MQGMATVIPSAVRGALWYLDPQRLDLERDKERIIANVLNMGTHEAVQWLFATYPREALQKVVEWPKPGEWSRKSLNFWALILGVEPVTTSRF